MEFSTRCGQSGHEDDGNLQLYNTTPSDVHICHKSIQPFLGRLHDATCPTGSSVKQLACRLLEDVVACSLVLSVIVWRWCCDHQESQDGSH
ncbi:hypothetical protein ECG_04981 [Echinococcus granulosus]|nr:hypothetical protein ECG_04981 [Echinococcus granulosus]